MSSAEFYKQRRDELRSELAVVKTASVFLVFLLLLMFVFVIDERDQLAAKVKTCIVSTGKSA